MLRSALPIVLAVCVSSSSVDAITAPAPGAAEIEASRTPPLLKRATASLRVYAFRGGEAVAIPFQVDERNRRKNWASDAGPQPIEDETPGVFDENDVIVFMNRDLGAKGDRAKLPAGASEWFEARVGAPGAPLGYAYVGWFDKPPALAPDGKDYAQYDPAKDEVVADRYTVRFGAPLPSYLAFVHRRGESGENVLNGVRARGEARILKGLFRLARTEKDFQYSMQGWHDGPVRAIRSAKYWIPLPLGFRARGRVELLFYGDFVEARANVKIKIPPRLVPADGDMTAFFEFRDLAGAHILGPTGALAEPVDGRMTDAERRFTEPPVRWSALVLPNDQTFLLAVRLGGSLQRLDQKLYLDDSDAPGAGKPSFGFTLGGVNRLDTGEQELSVNAMILDTTDVPHVKAAAATLLAQPDVAVTRLAR